MDYSIQTMLDAITNFGKVTISRIYANNNGICLRRLRYVIWKIDFSVYGRFLPYRNSNITETCTIAIGYLAPVCNFSNLDT